VTVWTASSSFAKVTVVPALTGQALAERREDPQHPDGGWERQASQTQRAMIIPVLSELREVKGK
jgi:hypothetical protein